MLRHRLDLLGRRFSALEARPSDGHTPGRVGLSSPGPTQRTPATHLLVWAGQQIA